MTCRMCASRRQVRVNAEVALTLAKLRPAVKNGPVYVIGTSTVCLACGSLVLKVPKAKLMPLRKIVEE